MTTTQFKNAGRDMEEFNPDIAKLCRIDYKFSDEVVNWSILSFSHLMLDGNGLIIDAFEQTEWQPSRETGCMTKIVLTGIILLIILTF